MKSGGSSRVTAVVLGGGDAGDPLAQAAGVAAKALVPYQGKPLAHYVLEALAVSGVVDDCVYVGPPPALENTAGTLACRVVPAGHSLAASLAIGLEASLARGPARLLVVTADLPWLSGEAVAHFVRQAPTTALVYPIVSRRSALAQFPGQRRTFVRLREGSFTGGNLLLIEPDVVHALLPLLERAYRARKNPLALASLLGPRILAGFLTGRLGVPVLEARVSRLLGAGARAFETPHACLGADADKTEHLQAPSGQADAPEAV
ncbi:MAG TPA: nucleotidyltransferase family protein [Trueperaceae bacterium]